MITVIEGGLNVLEDLGYSLTNLEVNFKTSDGKLSHTVIKWIYPSAKQTVRHLEQVPFLKTNIYDHSAINCNEQIYITFLEECDEILLSIKHDVIIKTEGNDNEEETKLQVAINLEI